MITSVFATSFPSIKWTWTYEVNLFQKFFVSWCTVVSTQSNPCLQFSAVCWKSGSLQKNNKINQDIKCSFWPVMCNSNSGIGTGIGIPGIFRAYGIGIGIESKAKITWWNWNRHWIESLITRWNWNRNGILRLN